MKNRWAKLAFVVLVAAPLICSGAFTTQVTGHKDEVQAAAVPLAVSTTVPLGAASTGRAVAFLNINSPDTYTVRIDGATILSDKVSKGFTYPFSGKSSLVISVECSNPNIKLTARPAIDIPQPSGTVQKLVYFDAGATTNGIFTTPVGVIVQVP